MRGKKSKPTISLLEDLEIRRQRTPFKTPIYIGIDPGWNGGVAIISGNSEPHLIKNPKTENKMDDVRNMADVIWVAKQLTTNVHIMIEKVWAFPKNSTRSAFSFGTNYGAWLGIIGGLDLNLEQVLPKEWMAFYDVKWGMKSVDRKKYLKKYAEKLYPDSYITLATSDAILIAHYLKQSVLNKEGK